MAEIALHLASINTKHWRGILCGILALTLGALGTTLAGSEVRRYIESIRPAPPMIDRIIVHPRDASGALMIEVKFKTSPTKECLRIGAHMMFPPMPQVIEPDQEFDLLPGSLAGEGWPGRVVNRFTLKFHMPSTIEPGEYTYTYRRFLQCNPWKLIPFQDEVSAKITVPPLKNVSPSPP